MPTIIVVILVLLWMFGIWGTVAIFLGVGLFLFAYAYLAPELFNKHTKNVRVIPRVRRRPYKPGAGYIFPRWKI